MANPGGVGTKFMSVNLNKSYGPVSHSSHGQAAAASRTRPGSGGGGGGGGGGMVVLSHPRPPQKPGQKLSVPPPLNLPSLRKEHEKFDLSGPSSSAGRGSGSGTGPRPNSSGLGWTKPGAIASQEKEGNVTQAVGEGIISQSVDSVTKLSTGYVPPSARLGAVGVQHSESAPLAEKTPVLRGEDFPSLKAALPGSASGGVQKQKDGLHRKQKHVVGEKSSVEQTNNFSHSLVHMRPQGQAPHHQFANGSNENGGESHGLGTSQMEKQQASKQEYFPGLLPLVMLNPRSDWADDERDTGHGFAERVRDHGFSKSEAYWDREFEMPRNSVLPHKPAHSQFERRGKLEDEIGKGFSVEIPKVDPYRRDVRTPSREGDSWRTPLPKDGLIAKDAAIGRTGNGVRPVVVNREVVKENSKYIPPHFGENSHDSANGNRESTFGRRDMGHGNEQKHQWNHMAESSISRGFEHSTQNRYISEQSNRFRGDVPQDSSASKSSFLSGGKSILMSDPILNFGRQKHSFLKSERTRVDEPFAKDFGTTSFDEHNPFSGGLVGVIKRKKDVIKQSDFHDPVRESFEAELERVQKMQEQERLRIIEEQERAMEQARREEEERRRLIREEEERRRRLEEEAREAAWRAEQERVEAIRRAEEQKIARDEEKQRMLMEEERRKQAAKQKLLELEAKIAMRQAEAPKVVNENTVSKAVDLENWEDSERMVERITTSGSSDSSALNRPFEVGPRSRSFREGSSGFMDRGKPAISWRRDVFEDGNSSSTFLLQNHDNGGRAVMRKEYHGGDSYSSSRTNFGGGMQEFHTEDFAPPKGHRWSASGDGGDPFARNLEVGPEFHESVGEKYSDVGWGQGQGRSHGYPHSPYSEGDELYSYGRSRYSMRQPRVLPPPSLASMHKTSFRGENESPGSSAFVDTNMHYNRASRNESTVDVQLESSMTQEQKLEKSTTPRCDSQSSLSVSSPPSSPTHLSHDDLDECGEASAVTEGKEIPMSGTESVVLNDNCGTDYTSGGDEDWVLDNDEELQEQEEYDEDEDGYEEEDEVHEGDDERIDLTHEFDDLGIEDKSSSRMMDNLVLGFDEGVEVGIPPTDEFERSSRNEESIFGLPEVSVCTIEEQGPPVVGIPDIEKAIQDCVPQPASVLLESVDGSNSSGLCAQNSVMTSVNTALHSSDLPVKLQFGLFSGPSLIPSPVPAIQIGSIQMPLHLHPPVGPSLTHMHPSQPPLFQFGQLRYTSPLSQGILPVAPQSVSFIQSNVQAHYNVNHKSGVPLPIQPGQEYSTHNMIKEGVPSVSLDRECTEKNVLMHKNQAEVSNLGENKVMSKRGFNGVDKGRQDAVLKSSLPSANGSVSECHLPSEQDYRGPKAEGPQFGNKGRSYAYSGRGSGRRSSFAASEGSHLDSRDIQRRPRWPTQRTEFRVRENVDRRQSQGLVSYNKPGQDDKSSVSGRDMGSFVNSGSKKAMVVNKPSKRIIEPQGSSSDPVSSKGTDSDAGLDRRMVKEEASTRTHSITRSSGEGNGKRNLSSEEDVDAPLQSGIVCVFKQPGIEAPSDGDDFIEVRSKRQMLNDRREQREKEIKAKSRVAKVPRKPRSAQNAVGSMSSNKISASLSGEAPNNIRSNHVASDGRGVLNMEVSMGFATIVSQPLPPIGTPVALNSDAQADKRPHNIKSLQTGSASVITNVGKNLGPGLMFETNSKNLDNVKSSLGSWDNAQISQQVMALTQTQLDEAMKPGRFDTYAASVGDHSMSNTEPIMPSSSMLTKEKSFTSTTSPINSLLAGEKIRFGAVTSPTVLPPGSSHGIGAPGSSRSDVKISQNLSTAKNDCTLFFDKDNHQNESCVDFEDSEAEAEAAASAVAVAAISSDDIVGNGLGTCSVSVSDSKSFAGADIEGIGGGVAGDEQLAAQSRAEESLSVALPADLSVDTPSISLWPPLPSPQNASSQMLSHFPGGPPSHFPFYEMNPMLGGPIFAFGPHDDSAGTQSQTQKSTASASGPLGSWQQCHSGVDSFYGPPAGFTGPYISPPGGIPGVQCPPHMVVYNHFPVGQFGQVGLSFMGTTYIPSGKQPDWKHNPTSSPIGSGEGDMNSNMNMVSAQRSPLNMASPVQHLSPASPLLPMASPFAMFDVSPFQSAPDMSIQGRWSHVPAPPLHSVPLSLPLQHPEAGVLLPSQFSHAHQSLTANRFSESQTSTPSDGSRSFPVAPDSNTAQFPDELGLLDSSSSTVGVVKKSSSGSTFAEVGDTDPLPNANSGGHNANLFKNHSTGYNNQRGGGGVSQKSSSGGEWLQHRRMGFHGRNQSLGTEKSYSTSSKMKQIYVAKQTTSGNSSAV